MTICCTTTTYKVYRRVTIAQVVEEQLYITYLPTTSLLCGRWWEKDEFWGRDKVLLQGSLI